MIPGSNLLNLALTVIARQSVTYYKMIGRALNNVGQDVTTYEPPVVVTGSFQPVPRKLYQQYGLDLQKNYYTFYVSANFLDVARDVSGDQIAFNGIRFQCESNNDWYAIDGWKGVLCVEIGADETDDDMIFGFNAIPQINDNMNFENGAFADEG